MSEGLTVQRQTELIRRVAGRAGGLRSSKQTARYLANVCRDAHEILELTVAAYTASSNDSFERVAVAGARTEQFPWRIVPQSVRPLTVFPIRRNRKTYGGVTVRRDELEHDQDVEGGPIVESLRALAEQVGAALASAAPASLFKQTTIDLPRGGRPPSPNQVNGRGLSGGVGVGRVHIFGGRALSLSPGRNDEGPQHASRRFDRAVQDTRAQLRSIIGDSRSRFRDVSALIFNSQLVMLDDDAFVGEIRRLVGDGMSPEEAVAEVVDGFARRFSEIEEPQIAEKAEDVQDLGFRLQQNLAGAGGSAGQYAGLVVILPDVYPSELLRLAVDGVAGIVLVDVPVTAHLSILARSLEIPVLRTQDHRALELTEGMTARLDADRGVLELREDVPQSAPEPASVDEKPVTLAPYDLLRSAEGVERISLLANVNLLADAHRAAAVGVRGIGLYRSEFPFIIHQGDLDEEIQYRLYRSLVDAMPPGAEITLRTADIGGDKFLRGTKAESNPFLGVRGIRFSLANRQMFRTQLRAMVRAGRGADLRIMFPMVSMVEEVEQAAAELYAVSYELRREGVPHNERPKLGAMIELPSAALATDELARRTDFLSIGTNDLVMYMLAVDRTNERLAPLYRVHHPIILKTLASIVEQAGEHRCELSVCGDAAANPVFLAFLLGIGVRKLSLAPERISAQREAIDALTLEQCEGIAQTMLAIPGIRDMERYIEELGFSSGVRQGR